MNAKKTLLLASAVFLFSSFSVAQMHSTSVPSTASMSSDPGGQMGVGASASSLTAAPSRSLADIAGGGPHEVVLPTARVLEHTAERVQAMPRIGQN